MASAKPRLVVKKFDVVSFIVVNNKKIRGKNLHKIVKVRKDLSWEDVVNKR